jgi:hypothetical protein
MSAHLPKVDQAQALLYHARAATPFSSDDGEAYASVPTGIDSRRVLQLHSTAFRDWLTNNFYSEYDAAPSADAIRDAVSTLEARARNGEAAARRVDYRLGFEGNPLLPSKIILDLANKNGEAVEITSRGWHMIENFSHDFRQSASTLSIPRPVTSGDRQTLSAFTDLFRLTAENRTRAFVWLAATLRPSGPYPILVLTGPSSSGKTILARALRSLIDPCSVPVRRLPARDHEIVQLAFNNWILVLDPVHRVPPQISEALCALSSGDTLIARPIVLVSPYDDVESAYTPPRTLANRTLAINLPAIAAPRAELAIWSEFEALRPALTAALCGAVSTALGRVREIDVGNVRRLPDCATWATAAAPALGLDPIAIAEAFTNPNSMWAGSHRRSHTSMARK